MKKTESIQIVSTNLVRESTKKYLINHPSAVTNFLYGWIGNNTKETLVLICLDSRKNITAASIIAIGSINRCNVTPREIFQPAILSNAESIVIAHNHPSGIPEPSQSDLELTKKLSQAGKLLGIELLDSIIIGERFESYSTRLEKPSVFDTF